MGKTRPSSASAALAAACYATAMALPSEDSLRFIVARMASILAAHGEAFDAPPLVLPNAEFFPDAISVSGDGLETLLARVAFHSPLPDDVPLTLGFVEAEDAGGKSCSSGACGPGVDAALLPPVHETDETYLIPLDVTVARHPVRLTTAIARGVGGVLLAYTDTPTVDPGRDAEIAAVLSGFGVLLANGANVFMKGCSGVKVHRGTDLTVEEVAAALAIFVRRFDHAPSKAKKHLEPTQLEAFEEALAWADQNEELLAKLASAPELLEGGVFELAKPKGMLSRLFGKKAKDEEVVVTVRKRTPEEERRLAEARALVEEALGGE